MTKKLPAKAGAKQPGVVPCPRCKGCGTVDLSPLYRRSEPISTPKADCHHPLGRRIGDYCAECGATVKGSSRQPWA